MYGHINNSGRPAIAGKVKVLKSDNLQDLVKEAQVLTGHPTRKFFDGQDELDVGFDGNNLTLGNRPIDENQLSGMIAAGSLFTQSV